MGTAQGKLLFENKKNSIKSLESDIQLLLLATRDSGKSTFFNQINFLQNPEEYKSEKIQTYKKEIYTNILNTMAKLCHHSIENGKFSKEENIVSFNQINTEKCRKNYRDRKFYFTNKRNTSIYF